jgi:putative tryptophan/tyrosine transport system substrate-binding protein
MPVIGFVNARSADDSGRALTAFRRGLAELGYVEGQNVAIEYHWLEGQYDQVPSLVAALVRRHVAVIAAPGTSAYHPARLPPSPLTTQGIGARTSTNGMR